MIMHDPASTEPFGIPMNNRQLWIKATCLAALVVTAGCQREAVSPTPRMLEIRESIAAKKPECTMPEQDFDAQTRAWTQCHTRDAEFYQRMAGDVIVEMKNHNNRQMTEDAQLALVNFRSETDRCQSISRPGAFDLEQEEKARCDMMAVRSYLLDLEGSLWNRSGATRSG
jgi:hypothetical protein